jgi:hypothetical protein
MCKLMASSVICFLLLTAAEANATPISNTTIPDARSTTEPAYNYPLTGSAALLLEPREPAADRNDSFADAGREGAPILLTTELTGDPGTSYESTTARLVTTSEPIVTLSGGLPPISISDENANRPITAVGTITRLNSYLAGLLPRVPEPVSLLLFGSSLLALAGLIRRQTRSADHSSCEPENSQLPAKFRRPNENALRVQQ